MKRLTMKSIPPSILVAFLLVLLVGSPASAQYLCVEGDCKNGKGKLTVKDGPGSLEGEFWNGSLIIGKVVFPNGDVFEGFFKGNELTEGVKKFKNGYVLEGKFQSSILVSGTITDSDGTTRRVNVKKKSQATKIPKHLLPPSMR